MSMLVKTRPFFDFVKERGYEIITVEESLAYYDKDIYLHHPYAYYRMQMTHACKLRVDRLRGNLS